VDEMYSGLMFSGKLRIQSGMTLQCDTQDLN